MVLLKLGGAKFTGFSFTTTVMMALRDMTDDWDC